MVRRMAGGSDGHAAIIPCSGCPRPLIMGGDGSRANQSRSAQAECSRFRFRLRTMMILTAVVAVWVWGRQVNYGTTDGSIKGSGKSDTGFPPLAAPSLSTRQVGSITLLSLLLGVLVIWWSRRG